MRHASLFSGIGGFDLAAQWMGWENVFQVEINDFCQKVLAKNFPNTKRYGDIKQFNGTEWAGKIDVLTGGFPCQPFSQAGAGKGIEDPRFLWPQMFRVTKIIRPGWVVIENVPGIKRLVIDMVCSSLEGERYETQQVIIPASALGAWHRRERVWIIANLSDDGRAGNNGKATNGRHALTFSTCQSEDCKLANIGIKGLERSPREDVFRKLSSEGYWSTHWTEVVPEFCRDNDGIPNRVDRIKSLGNAIVPQVAFEIFKAIELSNQTEKR